MPGVRKVFSFINTDEKLKTIQKLKGNYIFQHCEFILKSNYTWDLLKAVYGK